MQTFNGIIATLENSQSLEVGNQAFKNEIILDQDLSMSVFWDLHFSNVNFRQVNFSGSSFMACDFTNCTFDKTILRKCEFTDSTFRNCNIINSSLAKAEFDNNLFINCQFHIVNLGWSYIENCEFIKTKLSDITFTGTVIDTFKTKDTTFLNLKFDESFPIKFWKSGKLTEVTDSCSLKKLINLN